jgi:hypothetical protein
MLEAAVHQFEALSKEDLDAFGSFLLRSRTAFYDPDMLEREKHFEMFKVEGAPGAHTDAFDDAPYREGRRLLALFLAEAHCEHGRAAEARELLEGVMADASKDCSLPDVDGVNRYTDMRGKSVAEWFLGLCRPVCRAAGMDVGPEPGEPQGSEVAGFEDEIDFGGDLRLGPPRLHRVLDQDWSRVEELYRGAADPAYWEPGRTRAVAHRFIIRASDEERGVYRWLVMLLLRGLVSWDREVGTGLTRAVEQEALLELLEPVRQG